MATFPGSKITIKTKIEMITRDFAKSIGLKESKPIAGRPEISDFEYQGTEGYVCLRFDGEKSEGFVVIETEPMTRRIIGKAFSDHPLQSKFWAAIEICGLSKVIKRK